LPPEFGPWESVYTRFRAYIKHGIFDRLLERLQQESFEKGHLKLHLACFDGTYIRAHRHAAGARQKKTGDPQADAEASAAEQALGRSRGGFTTKIHMICDGKGNPLLFVLTPGSTHDSTAFDVLFGLFLSFAGTMKWTRRLKWIVCDKGYDCQRIFDLCKANGLEPVIPKRLSPTGKERDNPDFDKSVYRERNHVERCIGWLKENRRIATRYEKLAATYRAMIQLGMARRFLRAA